MKGFGKGKTTKEKVAEEIEANNRIQRIYYDEFLAHVNRAGKGPLWKELKKLKCRAELADYYNTWLNSHSNLPPLRGCGFGSFIFIARREKIVYIEGEDLCWARESDGKRYCRRDACWKPFDPPKVVKHDDMHKEGKYWWTCEECKNWSAGNGNYACQFCELIQIHNDRNEKRKRGIANETIIKQEREPKAEEEEEPVYTMDNDEPEWSNPSTPSSPVTPKEWPSERPTNNQPNSQSNAWFPTVQQSEWNPFSGHRLPVLSALSTAHVESELTTFLKTLPFNVPDNYFKAFDDFGLSNIEDLCILEDDDWNSEQLKQIKPFHRKKFVAEALKRK